MPRKRATPGPIGLGLSASWIELEPSTEANAAVLERLQRDAQVHPAMAGIVNPGANAFAQSMVIRERRAGTAVGVVVSHRLPAEIAAFIIYVDPEHGRAGYGIEATALYISHLFDSGARLVTADVLSFNKAVIGILTRIGINPQARLREHAFAAGQFWDVLVFSFTAEEWIRAVARYRRILPGGQRRPAAFSSARTRST